MDNVNIESVGGNSNLEDWASEETLQLLLRVSLDNKKLNTKQTAAVTEILKLLKKAHKQTGKNQTAANAALSNSLSANQQKATKAQTAATNDNTESKKNNTKETAIAASALGALAFATGALVKLFTNSYGTYNNLIKYGAIVQGQYEDMSGNIGDLGTLMKSSGASLDALERAITTSSRAIKMFGVKTFANTVGQVSEQLYNFGFTNSESAEFIAKDLESRRRAGVINNLTNAQYQQGLMQGTKNLMKFSKILGENWESLQQDAATALDANASFQLWIRTLNSKDAEKSLQSAQNVAMAFGSELGGLVADMAAVDAGAIGTDKTYVNLVKGAGQEVADMLFNVSRKIRDGSLGTEDSFNYLSKVAQQAKDFGINNQQLLQVLKNSMGEDAALKVSAQLFSLAESAEAAAKGGYLQAKVENEFQGSLKRIESNFDKMFNTFKGSWIKGIEQVLLSPETQKALNGLFNSVTEIFNSKSFQGIITGTLQSITGIVERTFKWINDSLKPDESGKTAIDRGLDYMASLVDKIPTLIDELTAMSRAVIKFIEDFQKNGLMGSFLGSSSPNTEADVTRVNTTYLKNKGLFSDDFAAAQSLSTQSAENKKLLKDAEKIWADPMYKSILDQHNYIPTALKGMDRSLIELARENVKAANVQKIPSLSMMPSMAFDAQVPNKVPLPSYAMKKPTVAIDSYAAKSLVPETKPDKTQVEENAKAIADASVAVQDTTEKSNTIASTEQDKLQPLVYVLDSLTAALQNLTILPDQLSSINTTLTSIKNGQNSKMA